MAAEEVQEATETTSKGNDLKAPSKLSHKQFRRLVKKERRRQKRQQAAKKREQEDLEEQWRIENDPILRAKLEAKEREEKKRLLEEENESSNEQPSYKYNFRETQHRLWLEREAIAQERFRKKTEDEARKLREKQEQEERIKREWEEEQRKEKEKEEQKQKAIKEKEDALFRELDKPSTVENRDSWHNPPAPPLPGKSYGTEQHPRPTSSVTLMIPAMYNDIRLSQSMLDEADQDTSLEYDEKEAYENFKQFYEDTLPEFRKAGTVVQFKVCCNHEPHLRGNVYVQFLSEEECAKAFAMFNARWYASKQLSCEFSPVTKWKSAICGLFERNRCPRGKNCNFLHVYHNPGNEFRDRDELSPGRTPQNGRRSERSDRYWKRDGTPRDKDRERSQEFERRHEKHWRRREKARSTERDGHRRRSRERECSRKKGKKRNYNSDEENETGKEDKELHWRLSPEMDRQTEKMEEMGEERHSYRSKDNKEKKKRRHHSPDKHRHKSKKKHKHHHEHKKKKRRSKCSNSSSSDSNND
ncbi:U2 small nuclear ribonucleoprotein auxiliary factor 35 kDa subunit-related protein 1 [Acropora cervicornis]|uniref:U2 small nuclear ribonucleoprotein auxiliary factor 35 kDa subunit-related protein 1 n=1 Tax=Acropora cervicornis TaxID=6130 RepID=A0AAD9VGZ0_ACRCE|nr:U2 small nuclear ribonucleoprotein auxiliary factor 35 kDa subunit-related protein 1 [Acropora cervicornis]